MQSSGKRFEHVFAAVDGPAPQCLATPKRFVQAKSHRFTRCINQLTKDTFEQGKAGTILAEQEKEDAIRRGEAPHPNNIEDEEERKKHEPSPRLVRLWSKEPEPNRRRGQARRALRLLVPCTLPGTGLE